MNDYYNISFDDSWIRSSSSTYQVWTEAKQIHGKVWPAVTTTARFFKMVIPQADNIVSLFANAAESLKGFFDWARLLARELSHIKIIPIASIPGILYDFAMSIHQFVCGWLKGKPFAKMADLGLGVINTSIDVTKLVAVFVNHGVFTTVAGFLSAINIVIQGKKLYHAIQYHKSGSIKHLELPEKLKAAAASDDPVIKTELRRRSIQKIVSHVLNMVAAAITVIATALFLVFPPLAPVAFGLFALSALISLADFITDQVVSSRMEKILSHSN